MISAKEHTRIIVEIYNKTGYYPYGYKPGLSIPDTVEILYNFSRYVTLKIGCWINYSDTTGLKDYTGMVYALMVNYRHFRTYTSLDQFLEDCENTYNYGKNKQQRPSPWQKSRKILCDL